MRTRTLCLCALLVAGLGGCGSVEPWVKPYERQNFADPIMSSDRDDHKSNNESRVVCTCCQRRMGEGTSTQ